MTTPFIDCWLKTGYPTERVPSDSLFSVAVSPEPDPLASLILEKRPCSPNCPCSPDVDIQETDNVVPDYDDTWSSIHSGSSFSDDENPEDDLVSPFCLTRGLLEASAAAIASYDAILESKSLKDGQDIALYLSRCSPQSVEHLHSAAIDAKNAAELRRSAALLDIDYFLRRLDPILAVYKKGNLTLASVVDTVKCTQKAIRQLEHSASSRCSKPQVLTTTRFFPGTFMHKQYRIRSKIHEETERRPVAHFAARLFTEDGRFLTDHRLSKFLATEDMVNQ